LLKITAFIVLAPVIGMALGFALMVATLWTFRRARPSRVDALFRRLQLVSAAFYSLGHGTNDAQKTMGIIAILLFSGGYLGPEFYVPIWVILAAHAAIGRHEIERLLPSGLFKRIHRSYIISISKIVSYTAEIVELKGVSIPIGRGYRDILENL